MITHLHAEMSHWRFYTTSDMGKASHVTAPFSMRQQSPSPSHSSTANEDW